MNERLTKRDTDGQAMMDCQKCKADWTGKHGKPMADCTALYCRNRLLDRLVEYEDTGLEPAMCANYKTFEDEAISKGVTFKRIVALMEADKDGWRILDTHLGSGSSRIATYNLGFEFVGCEIEPTYFQLQEQRFAEHTAQVRMW